MISTATIRQLFAVTTSVIIHYHTVPHSTQLWLPLT